MLGIQWNSTPICGCRETYTWWPASLRLFGCLASLVLLTGGLTGGWGHGLVDGRHLLFSLGLGCGDPRAPPWELGPLGILPSREGVPAAMGARHDHLSHGGLRDDGVEVLDERLGYEHDGLREDVEDHDAAHDEGGHLGEPQLAGVVPLLVVELDVVEALSVAKLNGSAGDVALLVRGEGIEGEVLELILEGGSHDGH